MYGQNFSRAKKKKKLSEDRHPTLYLDAISNNMSFDKTKILETK